MIFAFLSFVLFLLGEVFFACSEIVFISAERYLVERFASKRYSAKVYLKFWENPERLFTTTLLGITLCVAGNGIFTSYFLIKSLGTKGILISSMVVPLLMVVFGQILPKTIGKKLANVLVFYLMPPLYFFSYLFLPIAMLNAKIAGKILKSQEENPILTTKFREVFLTFIKYEDEIDPKEKELMHKILEFARKKVSQVMIPITQVKALPLEATIRDAIEFTKKYNFSYIPLYENTINNIQAIVKVQNILGSSVLDIEKPLKIFASKPLFFPEVAYAHEVLSVMQKTGREIAVIVDEYGLTTGIVTIEDLIEEVLGEFRDALDYHVPEFYKISENVYRCKGYIEIEKLHQLGIFIPLGDYETLSGFIYSLTGKIPGEREVVHYKNLEIKILKSTPTKIEEVLIKIKK